MVWGAGVNSTAKLAAAKPAVTSRSAALLVAIFDANARSSSVDSAVPNWTCSISSTTASNIFSATLVVWRNADAAQCASKSRTLFSRRSQRARELACPWEPLRSPRVMLTHFCHHLVGLIHLLRCVPIHYWLFRRSTTWVAQPWVLAGS